MKRILKSASQPDSLKDWKRKYRNRTGKTATYKALQRDQAQYQEIKHFLLKEQYFLCCYCCNQVRANGCHIEHFVPQDHDRSKQLDYQNMFVSCNGYVEEISTVDKESCGHRKDNWYDRNLIVSPVDPECERIFEFLANGIIQPHNNDLRADAMIKNIGLNSHALNEADLLTKQAKGIQNTMYRWAY